MAPKTSSWGCLLLLFGWLWFAGRRVAMRSSLFAPAPCYLLQLSICISHLQSRHLLFMLLSLCPIQSQPVFGSLCLFHCLIWRARRCFLLLSPGAWEPGGRRLVTLVWPSPPSQPAIKIGGRGWGRAQRVTHTLRLLWVTDGCTAPLTFLRTTYDSSWESKGASQSVPGWKKVSPGDRLLNWNKANASWIIELKASSSADNTIVNFLWQSGDIKMAGLILNSCYYFDGK